MKIPFSFCVIRRGTAGVLAVCTLFCALLWFNNLWSAWRYHAALFYGRMMAELPSGFAPCLNWSTADVSTVTTFIPFFGFLLLFIGVCRIRSAENWPFFAGYDRLNIALGLLGTLWGIILIGYYPADRVTIPALMSCLHTAMFSTLAAIAWVMVLEPLVFRPWLTMLRPEDAGIPEEPLDESLDRLITQLHQLGDVMAESGRAAAGFQRELDGVVQGLAAEREAGMHYRREMLDALHTLSAAAADLKEDGRRLVQENEALTRSNDALTSRNAVLHEEKENLTRSNETLTSRNAALTQELAEAGAQLAKVKNQLEAVRSALR